MQLIEIQNRAGKLKFNDAVHKESADKLIEELGQLYGAKAVAAQMMLGNVVCSADGALESVDVEINSPGGNVFDGHRIYNALREMSSRGVEIRTSVNGMAASMGSVILMAGDVRSMTKESQIMIHEASSMAWGDARVMRKNADLLETISSQIADIYAQRTSGDVTAIRGLMLEETWMDSAKAMELGFVHSIASYDKDKEKATASFDTPSNGMSIFAKLFPGNDEVAKIEAAIAENDTLLSELETAQARIAELSDIQAAIALKDIEITALTTAKAEVEAKLAETETKLSEVEAQVQVTDEKISERAAELLAAQGHSKPLDLSDDQPPVDHIKAMATMSPSERTKYFRENKSQIRKSLH